MPPQTQYYPVAGISPTIPCISQTDDERTAREARMSASNKVFEQLIIKVQGATTVCSSPLLRSFVIEGRDILLSHPVSINKISKYMTNFSDHFIETRRLAFFNRVEQSK